METASRELARERPDGGRVQRQLRGRATTLRWCASRLKRGARDASAARTPDARVRLARIVRRVAPPPAPLQHGDVVVAGAQRETLQAVLAALGVGGAR